MITLLEGDLCELVERPASLLAAVPPPPALERATFDPPNTPRKGRNRVPDAEVPILS